MPLKPVCPECGTTFKELPDSVLGKKAKCPKCQHRFIVTANASQPGASGKAEAGKSVEKKNVAASENKPSPAKGLESKPTAQDVGPPPGNSNGGQRKPPIQQADEISPLPKDTPSRSEAPQSSDQSAPTVAPPQRKSNRKLVIAGAIALVVVILIVLNFGRLISRNKVAPPPDGIGPAKLGMAPSDMDWITPSDPKKKHEEFIDYYWDNDEIDGFRVSRVYCTFQFDSLVEIRVFFENDKDIAKYMKLQAEKYPIKFLKNTAGCMGTCPGKLWIWYKRKVIFGYIAPKQIGMLPLTKAEPFVVLAKGEQRIVNFAGASEWRKLLVDD